MGSTVMTGAELKAVRLRAKLTQAEFGEAVGLSRVYVGLMERGERAISQRTAVAVRYFAMSFGGATGWDNGE